MARKRDQLPAGRRVPTSLVHTVEAVTPELAAQWLEHNRSNRTLSRVTVARYVRVMQSGRWGLSPDPLLMTPDNVINGQHRLSAIVESGTTQEFCILRGADESQRLFVDHGRKRSTADVLKMEFGMQYAVTVAAAARWINILTTGKSHTLTPFEVLKIVQHRRFKPAFAWLQECDRRRGVSPSYYFGPLLWLMQRYRKEGEEFHTQVQKGAGLIEDAPALRLRENLLLRDSDSDYALALKTLTAFEAFLDGRETKRLFAKRDAYTRFRKEFRIEKSAEDWLARASAVRRVRKARRYGT